MRNQIVKYRKILINVSKGLKKDARRYANKVLKENKDSGAGYGDAQNLTLKRGKRDFSGIRVL
jgi:hypothetical protein